MGLAIRGAALALARTLLVRTLLATLYAVILIGLSVAGIFFTAAPEFVSLLAEPFSLLLMPGLLVSLVVAGPHDYSPIIVLFVSLACYTVFFFFGLSWLARRRGLVRSRALKRHP